MLTGERNHENDQQLEQKNRAKRFQEFEGGREGLNVAIRREH